MIGYPWGSDNRVKEYTRYSASAYEAPDHIALDLTGQAMRESAGGGFFVGSAGAYVKDYVLGDMTETVYPVGGGFEDWAYAAGWDTERNAGFKRCTPSTKPEVEDDFFESQSNIASAVYLIETTDNKNPPDSEYGGRYIKLVDSDFKLIDYQTSMESIWETK